MVDFLHSLFFEPSVAQSLFVLTLAISIGLFLAEKIKVRKMTLGVTWVLFIGIFISGLGVQINPTISHFAKDFGLILFVYSIGLQVGPSFFSSLSKGGGRLNMMALSIVLLSVLVTVLLSWLTHVDMATMVGVMSGAVTNTPSLGAAQQAFTDTFQHTNPNIATGYAVAYPLGVLGIISAIVLIRWIFRVDLSAEERRLKNADSNNLELLDVRLTNQSLDGMDVKQMCSVSKVTMVISRIFRADGTEMVAVVDSVVHVGDTLRILLDPKDEGTIKLLGTIVDMPKMKSSSKSENLISRRIVVTKSEWQGQRICNIGIQARYNVTITRVLRAGVELLATPQLQLQLGDRLMVVGSENDVQQVADMFGNELKKLDVPNLIPIFFGIALGVIIGLLPITIPGMSQPFKFGLAGGSLLVALLMGRFGPAYRIVTFSTTSANMMLREIGLALFMASVGLDAGANFVPAILGGAYMWILYGLIITLVPVVVVGGIAYKCFHVNYFTLAGLIAGSTTDPPALSYAMSLSSSNDQASVAYATVYPLTMFLRVMAGQLMILLLCS